MSNINKAAVFNPFSDFEGDVFKYAPRASTTEYGVVALGSGIKIDDLGRIQFDTQEVLDRFTVIEDQIQINDVNITTTVDQINNTLDTKADKTYVDNQLTLKANKADVYTKQESSDLVNNSISTALIPVNTSLDLAKRGVANRYDSSLTYNMGERVVLANGDIVKSIVANNIVDPNVDMTGWSGDVPINNAQLYGCKPDGTDISSAFSTLANSLANDTTIVFPKATYFWDATTGTKSITKNINVDWNGSTLLVKPSTSPFLEFKSSEVIQYNGNDILNSLNAFDPILQVKGSPLANPCDYFVVLKSTEVLIHRAGFAEDYYKEVTLDIIDNTYRLRSPSPITFTDLSKLTVRFVKKSNYSWMKNLVIKPTEQVPNSYLLQMVYKFGMRLEDVFVDAQGNESSSVLLHYTGCCGLTFDNSGIIGANSDLGTSYAFLNSTSSYIKYNRCFYRDSGGAIKNERGHVGRHGFNVEFESCLFAGVDDHFGWDCFVKNMQMSRGITFCGGNLTVKNCYSSNILVNLREDTPYADGTLKIVNSFGRTHTLKAYGHTAPTALTGDFTKHKVWDVIDIDFDLYSDQMSSSAIVIKEPYTGQTDVYRNTILNVRGNFTQRLGIYRTLLDIWLQQNNTTGVEIAPFAGDLASKKLFSQVNIDVKHNKVIDGSTANTTDLIRGAVADEHNFKCNDLHFINVRGGILSTYDSQFKDSKYANSMATDVLEINLNSTQFKASSKSIMLNKSSYPNVKVYLENVRAPHQNILWGMFGDNIEYSKSIFDDESYKASNTWNLRNYRKGLQYEHTLASDLVIGANSYSSTVLFTWFQASKNDFKAASFYIPIGQVRIEIVNNGDLLDYQTAFRLFNTTGASVTVPAGTKIRFKVV